MIIDKIRKINIKGGKFETDTTFEFFENEHQRTAIVYGKNGIKGTVIIIAIKVMAFEKTLVTRAFCFHFLQILHTKDLLYPSDSS